MQRRAQRYGYNKISIAVSSTPRKKKLPRGLRLLGGLLLLRPRLRRRGSFLLPQHIRPGWVLAGALACGSGSSPRGQSTPPRDGGAAVLRRLGHRRQIPLSSRRICRGRRKRILHIRTTASARIGNMWAPTNGRLPPGHRRGVRCAHAADEIPCIPDGGMFEPVVVPRLW